MLGNRIKKECFAYSDDSDDGCKALKKTLLQKRSV